MAEAWFYYEDPPYHIGIFRVKIDERRIGASGKSWGTMLEFPIEWQPNTEWRDKGLRWEIVQGSGSLAWRDGSILTSSSPMYSLHGQMPPRQVKFMLTPTQAEELEQLRNSGDAEFLLTLVFHMALSADVNLQRPGQGSPISEVVMKECSVETNITIDIPKSRYEEKILPELGIGGLGSITITVPPGLREVFSEPLSELDRAQKTLQTAATEEQFESVVMQCRHALDALLNQFHFELPKRADGTPDASFASRVDALEKQLLRDVLSKSQAKSVRENLKALWGPYSGATKPGPPHHSRAYATYALHQAASHVKLISEVLWARQQKP